METRIMCKICSNLQSTKLVAIFLISFLLISISVFGQPLEIKLKASDGAEYDFLGKAVAISGNLAIAGAVGSGSASAYIFVRNQGWQDNWGEVSKLTASDGAAGGDNFGLSVAISGDLAIVGAYMDDDIAQEAGSAYIFARNQGGQDNWGQVKKLTASDGAGSDEFGWSVAINGDLAIVGARFEDEWAGKSGSAYIFARNQGGPDNWGQLKKLTASDGAAYDRFGGSVSISGDQAIVGAYVHNYNGHASGSAYIFARNQGGQDN